MGFPALAAKVCFGRRRGSVEKASPPQEGTRWPAATSKDASGGGQGVGGLLAVERQAVKTNLNGMSRRNHSDDGRFNALSDGTPAAATSVHLH